MSTIVFEGKEKMRKFIDFLHENDINKYVSLPEIAVMGDTSSGKSSLLSALTQVQLPSNDKITTRTPTRLRMENCDRKYAEVGIKWDAASEYKDETAWPVVNLDNWDDVATKISEAQDLILKLGNLEVAFNVVDLTLIDLPGIVRTVGKNESKSLIDDIKRLIDSYLSNPRCVILAVQPANVDFHNSQIMADAREVDPATRRTIPVITKPDLIDAGAEGGVKKLLLGGEVDFAMGFHMVKCRNQKALNDKVSMEEGIREEAKFFNTVAPWKDLDKELFGIVNLRTKLSKLQVRMIQESVPGIIKEIMDKRQAVTSRLEAFGSLATTDRERRSYFSEIAKDMTEVVMKTLGGDSAALRTNGVTFLSEEHAQFTRFRSDVLSKKLANMDVIAVGSRVVVTTANGIDENGSVDVTLDTTWLKQRIENNRTNDLPCFLSASVFNSIVADLVAEGWAPLCLKLLEDRKAAHLHLVQRAVASATASNRFLGLSKTLLNKAERVVQEAFEQAELEVNLSMETFPYTQNHYLFETITKMRNQKLKNKLLKMVAGKTTGIDSIITAAFNDMEKMSMEDHIAQEMQIILNAYGKVAAKRVIDNVPMIIQQRSRALRVALEKVLQVTDEELASLMVEDELTVRKVKQDTEEKKKLDAAILKLQELRMF